MPKKKKKSGFRFKKELTQKIVRLFDDNPSALFNYKQISARLNIRDLSQRKLINEVLYDLEFNEVIEAKGRGQFKGIKRENSSDYQSLVISNKGYLKSFTRSNKKDCSKTFLLVWES